MTADIDRNPWSMSLSDAFEVAVATLRAKYESRTLDVGILMAHDGDADSMGAIARGSRKYLDASIVLQRHLDTLMGDR